MNIATPAFLDESTLRYCCTLQILQIIAVPGYDYFVEEEALNEARSVRGADWLNQLLVDGRIFEHRICDLKDIQLVNRTEKHCGATRGEIASRVAAKSRNGIVIAQDPIAHELLKYHVPGVETIKPTQLLGIWKNDHNRMQTHSSIEYKTSARWLNEQAQISSIK